MDVIIPVVLYCLLYYCIKEGAKARFEYDESLVEIETQNEEEENEGVGRDIRVFRHIRGEDDFTGLDPVDDPTSTAMMLNMGEL